MEKPKSWRDYLELERDPERLRVLMRIRFIELLFTSDNATAIRAAEMLLSMSSETIEDDFSELSTEDLRALRERARRFISENGRENGDN